MKMSKQIGTRLCCLLVATMLAASPALAKSNWGPAPDIDVEEINQDIVAGAPTVDVGIYYASNFDAKFQQAVPLSGLMKEFHKAKAVFSTAGVQLNLLWVKSGELDPRHFSIQTASLQNYKPGDNYVNLYEESVRQPKTLSQQAEDAFEAIVEPARDNERTVYLIALQGVYMPYYVPDEKGRNWDFTLIRTGGLSFPGYMHGDTMPRRLRGVITLSRYDDENERVVSHELGHKLMNVSHEYMEMGPQHESWKDGGLMLYGKGVDIPSGAEGRWHKERLHLSPFVYRTNSKGKKKWNEDYKEDGFYYDTLYGDKVVHFEGTRLKAR